MPSGWNPKPGEIVHAAVQYSDSEQTKSRFPVIVSSSVFNSTYPDIIVAFTTKSSNIRHPRGYDVEISERRPDFSQTGLVTSSTVRCGRLWSLDKRKVLDTIGAVPSDLLLDILHIVRTSFVDDRNGR